ncbi:MAG: DUF350 domain-containing protein [Deltaproteobacteria bacterium]|nr:DUF350 domain-containing protein [Deltaproteobacteria bacterium]
MDFQTLFFTSYEVLLSLLFGLATVFFSIKFLTKTFLHTPKGNLLLESNTAASLFAGTMIVCVLLLVNGSVLPAVEALRTMALSQNHLTAAMVFVSLGYFLAFYAITLVLSIAVMSLSIFIYLKATIHIDEMGEIRKNNLAVAVLLASVVLGMTLSIRAPVQRFVAGLVNYQDLSRVEASPEPSIQPPQGKVYIAPSEGGPQRGALTRPQPPIHP